MHVIIGGGGQAVTLSCIWSEHVVHSSGAMRELILTNDLVLISYVEALLAGHGIEATVFDGNISLMEGSIGAFPRRVVVAAETWTRARRVLEEAGLGDWVASHGRG